MRVHTRREGLMRVAKEHLSYFGVSSSVICRQAASCAMPCRAREWRDQEASFARDTLGISCDGDVLQGRLAICSSRNRQSCFFGLARLLEVCSALGLCS